MCSVKYIVHCYMLHSGLFVLTRIVSDFPELGGPHVKVHSFDGHISSDSNSNVLQKYLIQRKRNICPRNLYSEILRHNLIWQFLLIFSFSSTKSCGNL